MRGLIDRGRRRASSSSRGRGRFAWAAFAGRAGVRRRSKRSRGTTSRSGSGARRRRSRSMRSPAGSSRWSGRARCWCSSSAMNGVNVALERAGSCSGFGWGVEGVACGDAHRGVRAGSASASGSAAAAFAVKSVARAGPGCLDRGPRCGGWRQVNGDILDPLGDPSGEFHLLHVLWRGPRRRDAGREPDPAAIPLHHRLCARRVRLRRRGAGRAGPMGARSVAPFCGGGRCVASQWAYVGDGGACSRSRSVLGGGALIDLMATAPEVRAAARGLSASGWCSTPVRRRRARSCSMGCSSARRGRGIMRNAMIVSILIYAAALAAPAAGLR
jgi:hypothetical protein